MPDRWRVPLGIGIVVIGVALAIADHLEIGVLVIFFGVFWSVQGAVALRRSRRSTQSAGAVAARQKDFVERLDRGETLDGIADDYERLHGIPPASTLFYLAAMLRRIVGTGKNPEANAVAGGVLARQAAPASEPPEAAIESFTFARSVFFVDQEAQLYADPEKPERGASGVLVVARRFVYFFRDPDPFRVGEGFAKGLAKERILDWTGVPYLGLASAGLELVTELRESVRDFFDPEVVEKLKKRFAEPGSFAVGLGAIVALERARLTKLGLPRERLVIVATDEAGREARYCLGPSRRVFDDRWVTSVAEVISTVCVMNGRMLVS